MAGGLAVVAMVRDEADVIELFVRINARSVDHLYLIDHDSRDTTRELLMRLRAEGLPLSLLERQGEFQQASALSHMCRRIAAQRYDYIIPLDADEFLPLPRQALLDLLQRQVPAGHCGFLPWRNHGPVSLDWERSAAPLYELMRPCSSEGQARYKVVIPGELAAGCVLSEGNHLVRHQDDQSWRPAAILSQPLLHAPVRSSAQIAARALLGSMMLMLKPNRLPQEGEHWDRLAATVAASGYRLDLAQLQEMLRLYTSHPAGSPIVLDHAAPGIGLPEDRLRWPELARASLEGRLHRFALGLCERLAASRPA